MDKPTVFTIPVAVAPPVKEEPNAPETDYTISAVELEDVSPAEDEKDLVVSVPAVIMQPVRGAESEVLQKLMIPLSGKLITADDPMTIGQNFRTLINMRHKDKSIASIGGMTKINSSAMDATYFKTRNAFHFKKVQPAETTSTETHILAQAWDTGLTASQVLQNIGAPPAAATFEEAKVWTDSAGAGVGAFSDAPNGSMAYCNGVDTCLWGGNGVPVSRFLNFDSSQTFLYDYTEIVSNSKTSETVTLTADAGGGGVDSSAALLLHLDNNVTDSSASAHTVTNDGVTYGTGIFSNCAAFWSTANLTIPDSAVFDLSDGTWSIDFWCGLGDGWGNIYHHSDSVVYYQSAFTSGSTNPDVGVTIVGNGSTNTAVVAYVDVDTGTWGAGDAAGTIYVKSQTGVFAAETINISGGANDIMTLSAELVSAGENSFDIIRDAYTGIELVITNAWGADLSLSAGYGSGAGWHHWEVTESGNNFYIFRDGNLTATTGSSVRPLNYIGGVCLGDYDDAHPLYENLDEFRVSTVARHTSNFSVPTAAYAAVGGSGSVGNLYIQTPRPVKGFKFYVATPNTEAAATASCACWNGTAYAAVSSLVDGTANTGTLKQTGSISFTSTVATAKQKYIDGTLAYTYQLSFSGISPTTAIYHVTADCPFQQITDLWDGIGRNIGKFFLYKTAYEDFTVNVFEDWYNSSDPTTFVELDGLTSTQCIEVGFTERMTAIHIVPAPGHVNTTAGTLATVYYWTGSAYTSVGTITDGTSASIISLANPGVVSWAAPAETLENKKSVNGGSPFYYYKIAWNTTLSADVQISHVYGIPAQKTIRGYKFPLFGQDRLLLCNNIDEERNAVLYAAFGTAQILNGTDSGKLYLGDNSDLVCGCNIFSQFAQSLYSITLIFKEKEIWTLVYDTQGWHQYRVSDTIGCNAPRTLKTAVIPPVAEDKSGNRNLAIWANSGGVYVSDGRHPILASHDIRDLFDQNSATHVNLAYIQNASAWVDQEKLEYHLVIATTTGAVTANDTEWVLDLKRWRWFKVNRGTALQCGISVSDAYGSNYTYGFIDTGYMERLEYGNTFDGTAITSTFQIGDFPLAEGDFLTETSVRKIIQFMVSKATTAATVMLTHFIDTQDETMTLDVAPDTPWAVNDVITGQTSGITCEIVSVSTTKIFGIRNRTGAFTDGEILTNGTYTADQGAGYPAITGGTNYTIDPTLANYRITFPVKDANSTPGVLHSFKSTITVNNETVGYEPSLIAIFYQKIRELLV